MSDLDDFDNDNFDDEDKDAKIADENDKVSLNSKQALEKRRLIDNLLEEKRLARELEDDLDDDLAHLDDDDLDDLDDDLDDEPNDLNKGVDAFLDEDTDEFEDD